MGVLELMEHMADCRQAGAFLVIGANDRPGGGFCVTALQSFLDRIGIGIPAIEAFHIYPGQLPLFQRIAFARKETAQLFSAAHVEPEFDQCNTLIHQHVLKQCYLFEERFALRGRAKIEHMFDESLPEIPALGELSARELVDAARGDAVANPADRFPLHCK